MKLPVALLAGIAGLATTTFGLAESRETAQSEMSASPSVRATLANPIATTVAVEESLTLDTSDAGVPKPKPIPKPKPQPRPDPCPACGMG